MCKCTGGEDAQECMYRCMAGHDVQVNRCRCIGAGV